MSSGPGPRSVKIGENERGGWTSERPRRPGEPERPPRQADVSVRGRVLAPTDRIRYAPGSLVIVLSADAGTREAFCARVLEDVNVLLSMVRLRRLLAGRVAEEQLEEKARQLLDATATKRLGAGQTVVIALDGFDAAEREKYVRLAHANRRPRHLVFVEVSKDKVPDEDRATVDALRTALDAGELGQEGFVTSLRLGGRTVEELKRIVVRAAALRRLTAVNPSSRGDPRAWMALTEVMNVMPLVAVVAIAPVAPGDRVDGARSPLRRGALADDGVGPRRRLVSPTDSSGLRALALLKAGLIAVWARASWPPRSPRGPAASQASAARRSSACSPTSRSRSSSWRCSTTSMPRATGTGRSGPPPRER